MRNKYFDFLRALAIVRVVAYHSTGWAPLTVVPAMALMFALGGSLMAASLDRRGARAVGSRLRRLLPPVWVLAACYVPVMLATGLAFDHRLLLWLLPLNDTPDIAWANPMLGIMWYVRQYIWFVLVSPLALPLFRRWPVASVITPYLFLVGFEFGLPGNSVLRDFGLYFGAWLIGFAHHDGALARMSRRTLFTVAGTLAAVGLAWIITHPGTRSYDFNDIKLGNGLWSAAVLLVLLAFAPTTMAWLERSRPLDRLVTVLNRRAVTIFLWHQSIIYGLIALAATVGLVWNDVPWPVRVPTIMALVVVPVVLFGWVEDLAARRRIQLLPGGSEPANAATSPSPSAGPPAQAAQTPKAQAPMARAPKARASTAQADPAVPSADAGAEWADDASAPVPR